MPFAGIPNAGNTCFLAALVQLLRASETLRHTANVMYGEGCDHPLVAALTERSTPLNIRPLAAALAHRMPRGMPHDPHEALCVLFDGAPLEKSTLHDNLLRASRRDGACSECGKREVRWERDICLYVDREHGTLMSAMSPARHDGLDCDTCGTTGSRGVVVNAAIELPEVLIVVVKDIDPGSGQSEYHEFISSRYTERGLILHVGHCHYVAVIRDRVSGQCVIYDDAAVRTAPLGGDTPPVSGRPYLLLLERKSRR